MVIFSGEVEGSAWLARGGDSCVALCFLNITAFFIVVLPVEIRGRVGDLERRRIRAACDASLVSFGGCAVVLVRCLQCSVVYHYK